MTFPEDLVEPIKNVPVTAAQEVSQEFVALDSSETWSSDWQKYGRLKGWASTDWPLPVPDPAEISQAGVTIDDLVELSTDRAAKESKEKQKVAVTLDSTVSFRPDSATLTGVAKATIKRVATDIAATKTKQEVLVEGFVAGTDRGSVAFQKKLSTDRANAVRKELASQLKGDLPIKAVGRGAANPLAPNDSEANRRLNRRVVITYRR